ncbi:hypothetical protein FACS189425_03390 [Clostridia bacterium]|nr:hypothetical protein FACS189425_03390 [Clostridia bacterium]
MNELLELRRKNGEMMSAIDAAIAKHHEEYSYDTKAALDEVRQTFGTQSISDATAYYIRDHGDGRISRAHQEWAWDYLQNREYFESEVFDKYHYPKVQFENSARMVGYLKTHMSVLDGFVATVVKQLEAERGQIHISKTYTNSDNAAPLYIRQSDKTEPEQLHQPRPHRSTAVNPRRMAGRVFKVRGLRLRARRVKRHECNESRHAPSLSRRIAPSRRCQLRIRVAARKGHRGMETQSHYSRRGTQNQVPLDPRRQSHAPSWRESGLSVAAHRNNHHE